MSESKREEMMLQKFEDRNSKDPVTFGSSVCLINSEGFFLSFNSQGEVKFDGNIGFEQYESSIAKLTKWVIVDPRNQKGSGVVTPFDDLMLRSPFGSYLRIMNTHDFTVGATQASVDKNELKEEAIFRMVKSSIPFLPDWLFTRPHLNHNNIAGISNSQQLQPTASRARLEERT